jgi:hypothetical protein
LEEEVKLIKVVSVVTLAVFALTAGGCPEDGLDKDGRAKQATRPVFTASGDYNITMKFHPKIRALKPTSDCEYWILWDIPGAPAGADAVQLKHSNNGAVKVTVDLGKKYTFNYTDQFGRKKHKKDVRGSTFVTKGCGKWYKV